MMFKKMTKITVLAMLAIQIGMPIQNIVLARELANESKTVEGDSSDSERKESETNSPSETPSSSSATEPSEISASSSSTSPSSETLPSSSSTKSSETESSSSSSSTKSSETTSSSSIIQSDEILAPGTRGKIEDNGDVIYKGSYSGWSNYWDAGLIMAARGVDASGGGYCGMLISDNGNPTIGSNIPLTHKFQEAINNTGSILLDYQKTTATTKEMTIAARTATGARFSYAEETRRYFTNWTPIAGTVTGNLTIQGENMGKVTGTYKIYGNSGSDGSQTFKVQFTFVQTADLKDTKEIKFSFKPVFKIDVNEFGASSQSGTMKNGEYVFGGNSGDGITLSIKREGLTVNVEPKSYTKKIGDTNTTYNPEDFVRIKRNDGGLLTDLNLKLITAPDTLTKANAVVNVSKNGIDFGNHTVPITYTEGNSLKLDGRYPNIATFSLNDALNTITATYNYSNPNAWLEDGFDKIRYYKFDHYWKSQIDTGPLNSVDGKVSFSGEGHDTIVNTIGKFGSSRKLTVSKGDVVGVYHAQPDKLTNYSNSNPVTPSDKQENNLYEITDKGFKLLGVNRLKPTKQTIPYGITQSEMEKNKASYLNTSAYSNVTVDRISQYPDTSKAGDQKGKIIVTETLESGSKVQWEYEITFNVDASNAVFLEQVPQTVKYGDTSFDAKKFVIVKDINGAVVSNVDVEFVTKPDTLTRPKQAEVKVSRSGTELGRCKVDVTYALVNTIRLQSFSIFQRFSLSDFDAKGMAALTATYDYGSKDSEIHSAISNKEEKYYGFDHYWGSDIAKGPLNTTGAVHNQFSANANDKVSIFDSFGTNRKIDVTKSDVVGIYHREPSKLTNWDAAGVDIQPGSSDRQENNLYEVTDKGFKLLGANRLKPSKQTIPYGITQSEMEKNKASYLDTSAYSNVTVDHISQYPDTSKAGDQKGKIIVTETLDSGSKVQWEYEITFNVDDPTCYGDVVYEIVGDTLRLLRGTVTSVTPGIDLSTITKIEIVNPVDVSINSLGYMFTGTNIETITGLKNLNTSQVTSMDGMFYEARKLTTLDMSDFDTSNVTSMNSMFRATALTSLDLSDFDTSNVTNMNSMFRGSQSLSNLNISSFDTTQVLQIEYMFYECTALTSLDLSNFTLNPAVTSVVGLFNGCKSLETLNLRNFNTSAVRTFGSLFSGCASLTSLDISSFDTSSATNLYAMFNGCALLKTIDVSNFDTSRVTRLSRMFAGCVSLTSLNMRNFDTRLVTDSEMSDMFSNAKSLNDVTLGKNQSIRGTGLPENQSSDYTSRWVKVGNGTVTAPEESVVYDTSAKFMSDYDGTENGRYVRQPKGILSVTLPTDMIFQTETSGTVSSKDYEVINNTKGVHDVSMSFNVDTDFDVSNFGGMTFVSTPPSSDGQIRLFLDGETSATRPPLKVPSGGTWQETLKSGTNLFHFNGEAKVPEAMKKQMIDATLSLHFTVD
ncbi:BspA family leucine-rich repeat surface protein [Listeria innocua]|uniref:BspA family leucine-rich repeat surface protein n=1 Tax=Listeria innocua TaxID=1642 RepID=UPI001623FEB1|nr:BspA family leucine-rich repeat surface protein [Listeria innocua]MBC1925530.1 BspA family leucine-rich repeat surface protein [Listeria innocua]